MLLLIVPAVVAFGVLSPSLVNLCMKLISLRVSPQMSLLLRRLDEQKHRLGQINPADQFAAFSRAERMLLSLQDDVDRLKRSELMRRLKYRFILVALAYLITGVSSLVLMFRYSSLPVVCMSPVALFPLTPLLSWPSCAPGCVSVPVWTLICGSVIRHVARSLHMT